MGINKYAPVKFSQLTLFSFGSPIYVSHASNTNDVFSFLQIYILEYYAKFYKIFKKNLFYFIETYITIDRIESDHSTPFTRIG